MINSASVISPPIVGMVFRGAHSIDSASWPMRLASEEMDSAYYLVRHCLIISLVRLIDFLTQPTARYFRARATVALFQNHLAGNPKLIDIGSGTCRIARYIQEAFQASVTPLDIVDYNKTDLKLILYNGKRIPFQNGEFDIALLLFVLHHSNAQETLLTEAKRVARKLIILEDTPRSFIERKMWHFWDWLLNLGRDFSMPYSSRRDENWLCFFKSLGFRLIEKKNFRLVFSFFASYQQSMYVLESRRR